MISQPRGTRCLRAATCQCTDPVPAREQDGNQMASDVAGGAGDEYLSSHACLNYEAGPSTDLLA